jgi:MraZ protein
MFRGHTLRNQDAKGRIMLPPDFREVVLWMVAGGELVLTNFDDCVAVYPLPEWESIEQSFAKLSMTNRRFRDFQRFFISGATPVTMDKQGRILVPPYLREYADLRKEIVLAGVGRKFEIWDKARFEAQRTAVQDDFDGIMDSLADQGVELLF